MSCNKHTLLEQLDKCSTWSAPKLEENIPHGDMPGDKVQIEDIHIQKANVIFKELVKQMKAQIQKTGQEKMVLTVCGGSGVGKSEIASILSYYFVQAGIGSYTLSGDNYPHKIPKYNDAQRLWTYRESAMQGMVKKNCFAPEMLEPLQQLQKDGMDADVKNQTSLEWFLNYYSAGKEGLKKYLGTNHEIGFDEVDSILKEFKEGKEEIWLRRMGRDETQLWYDKVDFSNVSVLIIEWTHGNSDHLTQVDIPILLNSTPQETLEHRRSRNRDGATDSPFTMLVLELEQQMLKQQAKKAKLILSKHGELLSYEAFEQLMDEAKEN